VTRSLFIYYHTDFTCRFLIRLRPRQQRPHSTMRHHLMILYNSPVFQQILLIRQSLRTQAPIPPICLTLLNFCLHKTISLRRQVPNSTPTVLPLFQGLQFHPRRSALLHSLHLLRQSLPPSTPTIQLRPSIFSFQSANHEFRQQTSALQPRLTLIPLHFVHHLLLNTRHQLLRPMPTFHMQ
jgi:hypothetical protein